MEKMKTGAVVQNKEGCRGPEEVRTEPSGNARGAMVMLFGGGNGRGQREWEN